MTTTIEERLNSLDQNLAIDVLDGNFPFETLVEDVRRQCSRFCSPEEFCTVLLKAQTWLSDEALELIETAGSTEIDDLNHNRMLQCNALCRRLCEYAGVLVVECICGKSVNPTVVYRTSGPH